MKNKNFLSSIDEVFELLQSLSDGNIPSVRRKLREGDLISTAGRATKQFWLIDDLQRYKGLNNLTKNEFPLKPIYKLFPGTLESRTQLFKEEGKDMQTTGDISFSYRVLPYSRAVEKGIGVCIERSILLQLSQQDKQPTFLVTGFCEIGNTKAYHAYNIIFKDGQLLVVDICPRKSSNGEYHPYIVPIKGIDLSEQSIVLPGNISDGRKIINKKFEK
jgi:hypothetical protein